MPQMVAAFNGVGGGAAALIALATFLRSPNGSLAVYQVVEILFGVVIGCVSFAGSCVAFAKLQELMTGRPVTYPGQQLVNGVIATAIVALGIAACVNPHDWMVVDRARPCAVLRRRLRSAHRRGRRTCPHLAAELVHGACGGGEWFRVAFGRARRGRYARRRLGHTLDPDDEPGDGTVAPEHPLQRLRFGHHRYRRRGRRHDP